MASIIYSNIFEAVTDDHEEASELQTRADLMSVVRYIVVAKGWAGSTQSVESIAAGPYKLQLMFGRDDTTRKED